MAFNHLLMKSLCPGKTSVEEAKKGAELRPKPGETVLVFSMDTDSTRACFNADGPAEKSCDFLYFWSDSNTRRLIFVELKSVNLGDFEAQLKQTIHRVKTLLPKDYVKLFSFRAVVVTPNASPSDKKMRDGAMRRFREEGIDLRFGISTSKSNKCNLRNLFERW